MTKDAGDNLELAPKSHGGNNLNSLGTSSHVMSSLSNKIENTHDVTQSHNGQLPDDKRGATISEVDDIDNDPEVILLTKFRLALGSTLRMLECARDDLVRLGERMDRLTVASRQCRERLEAQQEVQRQEVELGGVESSGK